MIYLEEWSCTQIRNDAMPRTLELRKVAGRWLKDRREACGLAASADKVGADYYTFISQVEMWTGSTG
jgi:hypothetical protein